MDSLDRARPSLRRLLRRHRRVIAAGLAGLALLTTIAALRPDSTPMTAVLLVTRDLPPGVTLEIDDLASGEVPAAAAVPGSLTDPADAVGRTTLGPLIAGEPLTTARLLSARPMAGAGRVTVPVRLVDPGVADLISPGEIIDLVAVDTRSAANGEAAGEVVARGARVVTVPRERATGLPGGGYEAGALILVSVPAATAPRLASLSGQRRLSPILRSP